jgi:hypothetical protein
MFELSSIWQRNDNFPDPTNLLTSPNLKPLKPRIRNPLHLDVAHVSQRRPSAAPLDKLL